MGIGLSGMISGMDTDSIVKAMVSAQRTKATKIENKITKNKWTTDIWSSVNTKIYSFYTKYASKLRLQSSYMTRKATSSDETKAKATATSSAAVGTHTLQIKSLASSQYVTGGKIASKADTYNRNTKLTDIKDASGNSIAAGTVIKITGKEGSENPKTVNLEISATTTVDDFLKACKNAGLTATFDTTQQRFFISSQESGKEDAFAITTVGSAATGSLNTALNDIKLDGLSEETKKKCSDAVDTLRQNSELLAEVLADDYDNENADKAHKAVFAAIETIKEAQAEEYAYSNAKKSVLDADTAAIMAGPVDGEFELYGKTYTEQEFEELKTSAEENVIKSYQYESVKKAAAALNDHMTENGVELPKNYFADSTKLSYAQIQNAEETLKDFDTAKADKSITKADMMDPTKFAEAVENGDLTDEEIEAFKVLHTANYKDDQFDMDAQIQEEYNTLATDGNHEERINLTIYDRILEDEDVKTAQQEAIASKQNAILAPVDPDVADLYAAEHAEIASRQNNLVAGLKQAGEAAAGSMAVADELKILGLGRIDKNAQSASGNDSTMAIVAAENAEFVLDGAAMTESTNNFTVNGLKLDLTATTLNKDTGTYDTLQITVGKDTDSTYNMVKEAIKEYNDLIEELNKMYYADSARKYEPLTKEQKEEMSDDEIEQWEKKIKDSLLRRDDTLGGILSGMRQALGTSYTDEEGNSYSLSTFGIVTGNYTERGKLHIYGDSDDSTYATFNDRLKKALEDDPDKVMEAMSEIFGNLYSTLSEKCAKTELSSALTFYNDKQYSSTLKTYESDLDKMNDKISDMEDKYYKQFTRMETALSKMQSQTNALASMLGTGTQQ